MSFYFYFKSQYSIAKHESLELSRALVYEQPSKAYRNATATVSKEVILDKREIQIPRKLITILTVFFKAYKTLIVISYYV